MKKYPKRAVKVCLSKQSSFTKEKKNMKSYSDVEDLRTVYLSDDERNFYTNFYRNHKGKPNIQKLHIVKKSFNVFYVFFFRLAAHQNNINQHKIQL